MNFFVDTIKQRCVSFVYLKNLICHWNLSDHHDCGKLDDCLVNCYNCATYICRVYSAMLIINKEQVVYLCGDCFESCKQQNIHYIPKICTRCNTEVLGEYSYIFTTDDEPERVCYYCSYRYSKKRK